MAGHDDHIHLLFIDQFQDLFERLAAMQTALRERASMDVEAIGAVIEASKNAERSPELSAALDELATLAEDKKASLS